MFFCLKYNKQIIFYHSKLIIIAKHVLNGFLIVKDAMMMPLVKNIKNVTICNIDHYKHKNA